MYFKKPPTRKKVYFMIMHCALKLVFCIGALLALCSKYVMQGICHQFRFKLLEHTTIGVRRTDITLHMHAMKIITTEIYQNNKY